MLVSPLDRDAHLVTIRPFMSLRVLAIPTGVRFSIKVVPSASRDRVMGLLGEALKVAVSKPPSGGAANDAVVELLARTLGIRASQVAIVAGHTHPRKEVEVSGVTADQVLARFT